MTRVYQCSECSSQEEADEGIELVKKGWGFVSLIGGRLGWICPMCGEKHAKKTEHIQEMYFGKKSNYPYYDERTDEVYKP